MNKIGANTRKFYQRFNGEVEDKIPPSSHPYNQAICEGKQIIREEYFLGYHSPDSRSSVKLFGAVFSEVIAARSVPSNRGE